MMPTMHRLCNRRSYLLPLLLATFCLPPSIFANTITIVSGNGSIGSADPVVQVSTDSGATYNSATIIPTDSHYSVIPGTQWLAFNSSGFGLQNTDMLFRVAFTLPAGFSSPQLSLSVFADNVATGILNGVIFGGQPFIQDQSNFTNPPSVFTTANPGLFQAGQNFLTVDLYNFTDPSGVDFKATITFVPEPSSFLLVGASLLGGLFVVRKRAV
jgi:PEP-CTERM motif